LWVKKRPGENPAFFLYIRTMKLTEGDYYIENGKYVLTKQFLLRRGYCCNSGCRHCPYGAEMKHSPTELAIKKFLVETACPTCGFHALNMTGGCCYTDPLEYKVECHKCGYLTRAGLSYPDWSVPVGKTNFVVFK
jgi:hypothetical protein